MVSRFAAFVIWGAVAACAVFWALRLWAQPMAVPAHATVVATAAGFNGDLSRVLGKDAPLAATPAAAPVQADPRFRLIGVVAPRSSRAQAEGVALIATDDKPAKAYRVGKQVDGDLVLLGVHARGALLGPRGEPAQVELQLPALPPPSTGTVPGAARVSPMVRPSVPLPPPEPSLVPPVRAPIQVPQSVAPPDAAPDDQPEPSEKPST